jgi:hypothetical protein
MLPRFIYDSRQTARHLLGRLATMTSTDGGAARLCLVTQSEDGHVRVNANGARIDDEFELQFSGDSSLSNGVYRVVCRSDLIVHAKLTKPIQQGPSVLQGESSTWLG